MYEIGSQVLVKFTKISKIFSRKFDFATNLQAKAKDCESENDLSFERILLICEILRNISFYKNWKLLIILRSQISLKTC